MALDAVLLHSFGGPNGPDDVVPFLRNVTAGKRIPDARLAEVGEHYFAFGGKSPINGRNAALQAALSDELAARGRSLPVVIGNRNWSPFTAEALAELESLGAREVAVLVTSAYCSYSGCWQYREDLEAAQASHVQAGGTEIKFRHVRAFCSSPGFVEANVDAVVAAMEAQAPHSRPRLVFVTHSIPLAMDAASGVAHPSYREQHLNVAAEVARRVDERLGRTHEWDLAFCSRSGPPHQPWLEPDINLHLEALAAAEVRNVVLAPIGFISDHMEVVYDLDTEALATARRLGLNAARAATAGIHPAFVTALADLVLSGDEPAVVGALPALPSKCPDGCCQQRLPG